jgi:hypothetical protein
LTLAEALVGAEGAVWRYPLSVVLQPLVPQLLIALTE